MQRSIDGFNLYEGVYINPVLFWQEFDNFCFIYYLINASDLSLQRPEAV